LHTGTTLHCIGAERTITTFLPAEPRCSPVPSHSSYTEVSLRPPRCRCKAL
jgi:hypothetical protein